MKRPRWSSPLLVIVPVLVALVAPAARAEPHDDRDDGFRCASGRLVLTGDRMAEVRAKCGDPDFASQRVDRRKVKVKTRRRVGGREEEVSEEQTIEVLVDEWTYDLGPRRFIRYVTFEDARVASVTTGGYGTRAEN